MKFIFLLCSERSGSNLIAKMLDSHPNICGPAPSHLFRTIAWNLPRYGDLGVDQNWKNLIIDIIRLLECQLGIWNTKWEVDELISSIPTRSAAEAIRTVYEREAASLNKNIVFVKENKIYTFIPFILSEYPDSLFVWMVRDPRDMAMSWLLSPNHPGGIVNAAQTWKEDQENFIKLFSVLRNVNRIFTMRYEELVKNPQEQLKKICSFLDIDFAASMQEFYKSNLTIQNSKKIKNWENLSKPVMTANYCKYRTGLNQFQIKLVESICVEEMKILGYPRDYESCLDSSIVLKAAEEETLIKQPLDKEEEKHRAKRLDVIENIKSRSIPSLFEKLDYGRSIEKD